MNKVVKSIELVKALSISTSVLKVQFTDNEEYYYIGNQAESVGFIDKEVVIELRDDLIEGRLAQVINSLTVLTAVNILDRESNIKLYCEDLPDIGSNINFEDINVGDSIAGAILFCTEHTYESSTKSQWAELTVLDKKRKVRKLRLFDPENKNSNFKGRYIKADIRYTKFGFNSYSVEPIDGITISPNPEIDIAKLYLEKELSKDKELYEFIIKKNLINRMTQYSREDSMEVGYITVRTAMEVDMARSLVNISPEVDIKILIRGIVLSKSYIVSDRENQTQSKMLQNIIQLSSSDMIRDKRLVNLIDCNGEINYIERKIMFNIFETVDDLITARKKAIFVNSKDKVWR